MSDVVRCDDVWRGENAIRPKNSAQELLLCVLFFRLVMCDMVRVLTHIECSHIVLTHRVLTHTSGPRTRPKNSAQELLLCVLFFRLVMCDVWCIRPKNSAQELGSRTGSLCSFLSACNVWCLVYPAQELGPRTRPKNWCIRPKNSAQELLLCVLFFRHTWWNGSETGQKRVRNDSAQELGPRTSSLCSFLSACNVWCLVYPAQELGPRTRLKNWFSVFFSFGL